MNVLPKRRDAKMTEHFLSVWSVLQTLQAKFPVCLDLIQTGFINGLKLCYNI